MSTEGRITVGQVVGVFGIKGWVKVKSFTETEESILSYKPWWLRTRHGLKSFEVDDYSIRPQGIVAHFVGCDDRDSAEQLTKAKIDIDRSLLPQLEPDSYYWDQLIGLKVTTIVADATVDLGRVVQMLETGANDVLVVQGDESSIDDSERLIPYVPDQFVRDIDLDNGVIQVDWDPDF